MPRRQSVSRRKAITVVGVKKENNVRVIADRYRLDSLIARTNSGEVHRGVDLQTCATIAIKIMRSRFNMGENFGARMRREFEVLQRVAHPAVVRVLDCGEVSETEKYLVMEFAEGESLEAMVKRSGPLPPAQIASVIYQIADALDSVHAYGFIHRDVNPGNIQVAVDRDGKWTAKLLDFGLVKVMEPEAKEQRLDVTGAVRIVGKAGFMPPEQFGDDQVSPVTDIYSLGASVFYAATGKLPYEGDTEVAVMLNQLRSPTPTISTTNLEVKVPEAFDETVRKAMDANPKQRFQSATDFAVALCKSVNVSLSPVATRLPTTTAPEWRWPKRRRTNFGVIFNWIIVFLATFGCLVYLYLMMTT